MSDTTATMKAVMERLNELGESLKLEIATLRSDMNQRFDSVEVRLNSIEDELSGIKDRIETLAVDIMETKANQRNLKRRIDFLEEEAS